jgi:uncharacterized protein (TIGR03435 family)
MTLRELVAFAFGSSGLVPPLPQILGGPNWIDTDRFDVVARAAGNAPLEPFGEPKLAMMMRTLLSECYKVTLHQENRALPMYRLLLARSDRMIGPQLRPAKVDCIAKIEALHATRANAPSVPLLSPRDPCIGRADGASLKGGAIEMSQVAEVLSNRLNGVVRDQTELVGMFEIDLTWNSGPVSQTPLEASQLSSLDPKGLSISKALQEQLGLRLEPTTGPVDVLVIDSASPPTLD